MKPFMNPHSILVYTEKKSSRCKAKDKVISPFLLCFIYYHILLLLFTVLLKTPLLSSPVLSDLHPISSLLTIQIINQSQGTI